MSRYAFTDKENVCKQIIQGDLTDDQLEVFDADYAILFKSTARYEIGVEDPVQIGWVMVDGVFTDINSPVISEEI